MKLKNHTKRETKNVYYCNRCQLDSLGKQWCPCPRGSCEASIVGKITTTTTVRLNKNKSKSE